MDLLGIEVTLVAVAYVLLSIGLQRRLANPRKTYEAQDRIKKMTTELTELTKNKADQALLSAKQKEITKVLGESMRSQMKPMFVILPLFLALYYLIFPAIFPSSFNVTLFSTTLSYKTYFIVVAFVLGLIVSTSMMAYDKAQMKKAARAAQQQEAAAGQQ